MLVLPNTAKAVNFTNEDFAKIENALMAENVPEEKIENLIEKLGNGELWDSMKEEYKDIRPQIVKDNYMKTIYPDGSLFQLMHLLVK